MVYPVVPPTVPPLPVSVPMPEVTPVPVGLAVVNGMVLERPVPVAPVAFVPVAKLPTFEVVPAFVLLFDFTLVALFFDF